MREFFTRRSTVLFAGTSLVLVAIKLLFQFYPGQYPIKSQAAAFSWPLVGGVLVIGFLGLLADRAARLPEPLANRARDQAGVLVAVETGVLYGLITIGMYVWHPSNSPLSSGGWEHVLLPWSIPFYAFGAIFLEYLLRLGALCIAFWLFHVLILRRHFRQQIYWVLAALVALYEIWPYLVDDTHAHRWGSVALTAIEPLYVSNVFEGWLSWRYGWFTPIVFRLAFYLVWHILFGGLAGPLFGH